MIGTLAVDGWAVTLGSLVQLGFGLKKTLKQANTPVITARRVCIARCRGKMSVRLSHAAIECKRL